MEYRVDLGSTKALMQPTSTKIIIYSRSFQSPGSSIPGNKVEAPVLGLRCVKPLKLSSLIACASSPCIENFLLVIEFMIFSQYMSRKSMTDPSGFCHRGSFPRKGKGTHSILGVRPAKFSGTPTKDFIYGKPLCGVAAALMNLFIYSLHRCSHSR